METHGKQHVIFQEVLLILLQKVTINGEVDYFGVFEVKHLIGVCIGWPCRGFGR